MTSSTYNINKLTATMIVFKNVVQENTSASMKSCHV